MILKWGSRKIAINPSYLQGAFKLQDSDIVELWVHGINTRLDCYCNNNEEAEKLFADINKMIDDLVGHYVEVKG